MPSLLDLYRERSQALPEAEANFARQQAERLRNQPDLSAPVRGQFSRGFESSAHKLIAGVHAVRALGNEYFGDNEQAQKSLIDMRQRQAQAQAAAPLVQQASDIDSFGAAMNYATGQAGSALASMLPSVVGAGLGRLGAGLVGATGKIGKMAATGAGAYATSMPMQTGEIIQKQYADPEALKHSAAERGATALKWGSLAAVPDIIQPVSFAHGVGNMFKKGVINTAREATIGAAQEIGESGIKKAAFKRLPGMTGSIGRAMARDAVIEGTTEAGQEWMGQQAATEMNASRDTSNDGWDLFNAGVGGAVGGAMFGAPSGIATGMKNTVANGIMQAKSKAAAKAVEAPRAQLDANYRNNTPAQYMAYVKDWVKGAGATTYNFFRNKGVSEDSLANRPVGEILDEMSTFVAQKRDAMLAAGEPVPEAPFGDRTIYDSLRAGAEGIKSYGRRAAEDFDSNGYGGIGNKIRETLQVTPNELKNGLGDYINNLVAKMTHNDEAATAADAARKDKSFGDTSTRDVLSDSVFHLKNGAWTVFSKSRDTFVEPGPALNALNSLLDVTPNMARDAAAEGIRGVSDLVRTKAEVMGENVDDFMDSHGVHLNDIAMKGVEAWHKFTEVPQAYVKLGGSAFGVSVKDERQDIDGTRYVKVSILRPNGSDKGDTGAWVQADKVYQVGGSIYTRAKADLETKGAGSLAKDAAQRTAKSVAGAAKKAQDILNATPGEAVGGAGALVAKVGNVVADFISTKPSMNQKANKAAQDTFTGGIRDALPNIDDYPEVQLKLASLNQAITELRAGGGKGKKLTQADVAAKQDELIAAYHAEEARLKGEAAKGATEDIAPEDFDAFVDEHINSMPDIVGTPSEDAVHAAIEELGGNPTKVKQDTTLATLQMTDEDAIDAAGDDGDPLAALDDLTKKKRAALSKVIDELMDDDNASAATTAWLSSLQGAADTDIYSDKTYAEAAYHYNEYLNGLQAAAYKVPTADASVDENDPSISFSKQRSESSPKQRYGEFKQLVADIWPHKNIPLTGEIVDTLYNTLERLTSLEHLEDYLYGNTRPGSDKELVGRGTPYRVKSNDNAVDGGLARKSEVYKHHLRRLQAILGGNANLTSVVEKFRSMKDASALEMKSMGDKVLEPRAVSTEKEDFIKEKSVDIANTGKTAHRIPGFTAETTAAKAAKLESDLAKGIYPALPKDATPAQKYEYLKSLPKPMLDKLTSGLDDKRLQQLREVFVRGRTDSLSDIGVVGHAYLAAQKARAAQEAEVDDNDAPDAYEAAQMEADASADGEGIVLSDEVVDPEDGGNELGYEDQATMSEQEEVEGKQAHFGQNGLPMRTGSEGFKALKRELDNKKSLNPELRVRQTNYVEYAKREFGEKAAEKISEMAGKLRRALEIEDGTPEARLRVAAKIAAYKKEGMTNEEAFVAAHYVLETDDSPRQFEALTDGDLANVMLKESDVKQGVRGISFKSANGQGMVTINPSRLVMRMRSKLALFSEDGAAFDVTRAFSAGVSSLLNDDRISTETPAKADGGNMWFADGKLQFADDMLVFRDPASGAEYRWVDIKNAMEPIAPRSDSFQGHARTATPSKRTLQAVQRSEDRMQKALAYKKRADTPENRLATADQQTADAIAKRRAFEDMHDTVLSRGDPDKVAGYAQALNDTVRNDNQQKSLKASIDRMEGFLSSPIPEGLDAKQLKEDTEGRASIHADHAAALKKQALLKKGFLLEQIAHNGELRPNAQPIKGFAGLNSMRWADNGRFFEAVREANETDEKIQMGSGRVIPREGGGYQFQWGTPTPGLNENDFHSAENGKDSGEAKILDAQAQEESQVRYYEETGAQLAALSDGGKTGGAPVMNRQNTGILPPLETNGRPESKSPEQVAAERAGELNAAVTAARDEFVAAQAEATQSRGVVQKEVPATPRLLAAAEKLRLALAAEQKHKERTEKAAAEAARAGFVDTADYDDTLSDADILARARRKYTATAGVHKHTERVIERGADGDKAVYKTFDGAPYAASTTEELRAELSKGANGRVISPTATREEMLRILDEERNAALKHPRYAEALAEEGRKERSIVQHELPETAPTTVDQLRARELAKLGVVQKSQAPTPPSPEVKKSSVIQKKVVRSSLLDWKTTYSDEDGNQYNERGVRIKEPIQKVPAVEQALVDLRGASIFSAKEGDKSKAARILDNINALEAPSTLPNSGTAKVLANRMPSTSAFSYDELQAIVQKANGSKEFWVQRAHDAAVKRLKALDAGRGLITSSTTNASLQQFLLKSADSNEGAVDNLQKVGSFSEVQLQMGQKVMASLLDEGMSTLAHDQYKRLLRVSATITNRLAWLKGEDDVKKFSRSHGDATPLTTAERKEVTDYLVKTLGPKVNVSFSDTFKAAGGFKAFKGSDGSIEKMVVILSSTMPEGTHYHESMHGFMTHLTGTNHGATLLRAARSEHVKAQLRTLLAGSPEAIMDMENDPQETLAYAFQFHALGKLTLKDEAAEGVFAKIKEFFRKVLRITSTDEKASRLMHYLRETGLPNGLTPETQRALTNASADKWSRTVEAVAKNTVGLAEKYYLEASTRMHNTGIPAFSTIADKFWPEEGKGVRTGMLQRAGTARAKMTNAYLTAINGASDDDMAEAVKHLREGTTSDKPSVNRVISATKSALAGAYSYLSEAGLEMKKRNNYLPRVWSVEALQQNPEGFKALLHKYGVPENEAERAWSKIVLGAGSELDINVDVHNPKFGALSERKLPEMSHADMAPFVENNLMGIMSRYFAQGAKRAEFHRSFGKGGEQLTALLARARDEGATPEELEMAVNTIKAAQGTLGVEHMSERFLKANTWVMTYQNIRVLPLALLSSLTDPLGISVRTGSLTEGVNAFIRGVKDVPKWLSKNPEFDEKDRIALEMGQLDNRILAEAYGGYYNSMLQTGTARKINDAFFKYNLIEGWNNSMRVASTHAAANFIEKHLTRPNEHSARYMEELRLTLDDVAFDADGKLVLDASNTKLVEAITKFVDGSVLRPNAMHRPLWGSDPRFAILFHLRQFVHSFQKVILGRVMHELEHKSYKPAAMLLAYVPVTMAALALRGMVTGGGELPDYMKGWTASDWLLHSTSHAGLGGKVDLLYSTGESPSMAAGPTVSQVVGLGQGAYNGRLGHEVSQALPAYSLYSQHKEHAGAT